MATIAEQVGKAFERGETAKPLPVRFPRGGKLSPEQKRYIVKMFAHFSDLHAVRRLFEEAYGYSLLAPTLARYDPERPQCRLSPAMRRYYAECRAAYLADVESIGIAHQGHRLRVLNRMAQQAENKGQYGTAAGLLKQAAEELGGVLTNERKVNVTAIHLSLADAKAELATRLAAIVEEQALLPPPEQGDPDT